MPMNSLSTALRLSASVSRLGLPHNASGDDGAGVTSGHYVIPGQRPGRVPNPSNFLLSLAHPTSCCPWPIQVMTRYCSAADLLHPRAVYKRGAHQHAALKQSLRCRLLCDQTLACGHPSGLQG